MVGFLFVFFFPPHLSSCAIKMLWINILVVVKHLFLQAKSLKLWRRKEREQKSWKFRYRSWKGKTRACRRKLPVLESPVKRSGAFCDSVCKFSSSYLISHSDFFFFFFLEAIVGVRWKEFGGIAKCFASHLCFLCVFRWLLWRRRIVSLRQKAAASRRSWTPWKTWPSSWRLWKKKTLNWSRRTWSFDAQLRVSARRGLRLLSWRPRTESWRARRANWNAVWSCSKPRLRRLRD